MVLEWSSFKIEKSGDHLNKVFKYQTKLKLNN
jgi:hypothetical protein